MHFCQTLQSEFLKHKHSLLWQVSLLIPSGVAFALFLDVRLRKIHNFLSMAEKNSLNPWEALLLETHFSIGWGRFLPIIILVLAVIIYSREYLHDSWTNLFTLPVRKTVLYLQKFFLILFFGWLIVFLSVSGIFAVGLVLGFSADLSVLLMFGKYFFLQCLTILGVAALHNWISSYFKSPLTPIFIGVGGVIVSAILLQISVQVGILSPYLYPYLIGGFLTEGYQGQNPLINSYAGVISGIIFTILGYLELRQRDIL